MKIAQAFTTALLIAGCSSESPIEQRELVLRYDETALSANVREDGTFDSSKESELETVTFSGTVSEQDERYQIALTFSRQVKGSSSSTELGTTIVLMTNESAIVGGVNGDVYSVALQ